MKKTMPFQLMEGRVRHGPYASDDSLGLTGAFFVTTATGTTPLKIISSGPPEVWEHVSVSCENRCPTWEEMCFVKNLFWGEDEWVVQFHPSKDQYVNCHPFTLHLWKFKRGFPTPPSTMVGPK